MNRWCRIFSLSVKLNTLILLMLFYTQGKTQDIGILTTTSPSSGCELSSSEFVTVVIFNFGSPYSGSFDVSYQINGGVPTTETITLASFPSTSTYSYTFTTTADLSITNTYNFSFYTNLTGDINNNNDTITNVVISDTLSYGGTINTSQSVCIDGNNGILNLNTAIGDVQYWEYSINSGSSWTNISNTTDTISFNNITQETWYRAVVLNGFCPQDTSAIAILSIDSSSIGGTLSGTATICVPPNNGTLSLSNEQGTILDWEYSSNGGTSWNSLSHTSNTYNYTNQPSTYLYRTLIQNGNCEIAYSDTAEITVLNGAFGGNTSPSNQTVCSGTNSGTISLSGQSGSIIMWQSSTNGGTSWTPIPDTSSILSFSNITLDTWYRAVVSDCNIDTSSIAIVTVESMPNGGNLSSNTIVCENANSGTIMLNGQIGNIIDWESSDNGGISWTSLNNSTNIYTYNNLISSTLYRVVVGNNSCSNVYSDTVTITVNNMTNAGIITGTSNVCATGNSGNITTSGVVGNVYDWEYSTNNGFSWTSLGNSTNTYSFTNLTQSTIFQVIAENGVCPNDTSQHAITVDDASNPGTLFVSDTVCYGSSGMIYLNSYQGTITYWENSTDNGLNWNSLSVTTDTLTYTNISSATMYRTFVQNGVCPQDTSNEITLNIYPFNISTSNDTTINSGSSATISATGGLLYSWTPTTGLGNSNTATTDASPTITTSYIVSIFDTYGCLFQDSVLVTVNPLPVDSTPNIKTDIIVADLITANNDGYNDTWNIIGIENYPDTKVAVFNAFGNLIYESADYQNDWKGTWNGKQLSDGTYYYILEIKDEVRKGFITIISSE